MQRALILILFLLSTSLAAQTFTELGRFAGSGAKPGLLNTPHAIAISKENKVYIADTGNNRIQIFDSNGKFIKSIGGFGFKNDQFDAPRDIWLKGLINIYIADYNNQRLQRYDRNMNFISTLINNEAEETDFQFYEIASCATSSQNELFIIDHDAYKIVKFNREGTPLLAFGQFESGLGALQQPEQLDIVEGDRLVVTDSEAKTVFIFDLFGNFLKGITDDALRQPKGVGISLKNELFIADEEAKAIFYAPSLSDSLKKITFGSGFKAPVDVAVLQKDKQTFLYVLDGDEVVIGTFSPAAKFKK